MEKGYGFAKYYVNLLQNGVYDYTYALHEHMFIDLLEFKFKLANH